MIYVLVEEYHDYDDYHHEMICASVSKDNINDKLQYYLDRQVLINKANELIKTWDRDYRINIPYPIFPDYIKKAQWINNNPTKEPLVWNRNSWIHGAEFEYKELCLVWWTSYNDVLSKKRNELQIEFNLPECFYSLGRMEYSVVEVEELI